MPTPAPSPHAPVREAWLAQVSEEVLDPGLPIVDPHHHLWQRHGNDYLFHDLLADTQTGHNIVGTVFVEIDGMFYTLDRCAEAEGKRRTGACLTYAGELPDGAVIQE